MPDDRETPEKSNDYDESAVEQAGASDDAPAGNDRNFLPNEEVKAAQERYLRLAADFENYKKRTQKDQEEFRKYANERLLKELLPVLDNLQRALQHGHTAGNADGVLQGVELTYKQYQDILSRFGLKPIPSVGQRFDPAVHQAVATVKVKGQAPNTIVEEYEKGYLLHDRVLRPSMVTVTETTPTRENSDS